MEKELQKEILKLFLNKRGDYVYGEGVVLEEIRKIFSKKVMNNEIKKEGQFYNNEIEENIKFLLDDGSLVETEDKNHYRITEWGVLRVRGGFKKMWYWLIYRKHNLSVLISIISLIISIFALFCK